ncbi:MAG: hypothetical protein WCK27_32915 [Verrucomicrobiota bacterium]
MHPRLQIAQISEFLDRYNYPLEDEDLLHRRSRIQKEKKMRLEDLCAVCDWKAPRAAGHAKRNDRREVEEITAAALRAQSERVRVEMLQVLHGVSYPTASVILHFYHRDVYPILDFRALWSMGFAQPSQYTFAFWWDYVQATRDLLARARRVTPSLSMRKLDRALWQYSKERQRRG